MARFLAPVGLLVFYCAWPLVLCAAEPPAAAEEPQAKSMDQSIAEVAQQAKDSIVVITVAGRDGAQFGLGTGFVVSADGLIATNLHVIGEARPITVQLADGRKFDVTSVHASDRALDLAVVRIDAHDLPVLSLGDSDKLQQGQPIVAMGNPQGLKHSVVGGVVSGTREVENRKMIQLAIPIEPGNSGGPALDLQGRVQGIVTMKSAVTENLGFAMPSSALRPLLEKPNPVPMSRWLTIGALDPKEWTTLFGARWQQRAGRILVQAPGEGFGGRALCLSQTQTPDLPYEVAVSVKLDDEAGAAGLVFHSDGNLKHYGFYPSAGKLRLTRFDGGDVYSWTVLYNEATEHYLPGDWNQLKVRLEKDKILCYVNDHLVLESKDTNLPIGKVGLAKFRTTQAEFKRFRVAPTIPVRAVDAAASARLAAEIDKLESFDNLLPKHIAPLAAEPASSVALLNDRATELERRAKQMRRVAADVHTQGVVAELTKLLDAEDGAIDLGRAALTIARLDDDELDIDAYMKQLDRMAAEISAGLAPGADEPARLAALGKYLFADNGFHGSRTDYYHKANSYLNRVIDDREGLPITLAVLYMELAQRIGLKVEGVSLPGHFMVRHRPADEKLAAQLIDVFEGGKVVTPDDAGLMVLALGGGPLTEEQQKAATRRSIVRRMLGNLQGIAQRSGDKEALLRYLEAMVAIDPTAAPDRGLRAVVRYETGRRDAAISDLDWFLEHAPEGVDLDRIHQMRDYFLKGQK